MPRRFIQLSGCIGVLLLYLLFFLQHASAQVRVSGMVAEADNRTGVPGVTIVNKSTRSGVVSNESGRFAIDAMPGDTLEFSMLGYYKKDLAVPTTSMFINVYLTRQVIGLTQVNVVGKDYKQDSLATRQEYGRYFNYHKPGAMDVLKTLPSNPITALTYLVPSKTRKRKEHFQEQLVYWEKEKYIDNRYNPELVERMTKLSGDELDTFMLRYRPGYQFLQDATDYDLMLFIKESFKHYQQERAIAPPARKPDE
ncbi:carboxypeptidase-like regulatory domain-containing protein [Chitinophaga rhizophila]|uniref:Carboxypeptidase-like regulatory domain-containing protein n=1 Tax=Chitinophaga rhizophila TaxID=2866212 RepID=A0ABS7GDI2_9BACT|nr:carboxypeptidase-like regulatory domain-containing protein [Chitinophaga rhizophila]MBW8685736.1 carboxypeptidase-like regulatory domain-containing protein [Chitinophaga rhizophila]